MDLYEALKSGTSAQELQAQFNQQLNEAKARIIQEEEDTEAEEWLDACRSDLADSIYEYALALMREDELEDWTPDKIEQDLVAFEESFKRMNELTKVLKEKVNGSSVTLDNIFSKTLDDNDIIKSFLKTLG
jgi:uncharacterized membrane protein YheB (UPF0754 family)